MDVATEYALAYALTTAAGLRAVLALAAVSVAAHLGIIHPSGGFEWLASVQAMWALIAVAVLEIAADKIPFLDHALHVAQVVVKPAAAAIIVGGTLNAPSEPVLISLMAVGALNALGVHAGVVSMRGASTVMTGGLANPVLSTAEDAGTIGGIVLAFLAPFIAAALAVLVAIGIVLAARRGARSLAR
jgi:hypothetical protein